MSVFNRDNKNSFSVVKQENISLESAFLNKKLNQAPYIQSVKFTKNPNIKQSKNISSGFTLNDKHEMYNPNLKKDTEANNTMQVTKFSSNKKNTNEDIQEKLNQYLTKFNKFTNQFKTFKEKTQPLNGNINLLRKDSKTTTLDSTCRNNCSMNIPDSSNTLKNTNKVNSVSNNANFAFNDFEHYNKKLYHKQLKLLETIDIEPVNNEKDKNLNSNTNRVFMKQYTYNNSSENLENTIETKLNLIVSRFIPYFTTISHELKHITNKLKVNNDYIINNIEVKLKHLEDNISNLTKTTDINSLGIENLQENLKCDTLNSLFNSVKNLSVRINNLFLKFEDEKQESVELLTKINKLENTFNNAIKTQIEGIEVKLNNLQNHMSSSSELNKKDLLNNVKDMFKDMFKIFSNAPDIMTMLEKSISNIRLKQDDLLKNAISIKEQLLNNSKEISSIKDSSKEHSKIFELVKDLQKSQCNIEEQNIFNEKIHKDMELIKKNILKLMQEQQAQEENTLNNKNTKSEHKQNQPVVNNKYEEIPNDKGNSLNAKVQHNILNTNKYINEKDNNSSKIQDTITKLKGALDLEDALDAGPINKENINKVLKNNFNSESKNHSSKADSYNSKTIHNFSNTENKSSQNKSDQNNQKNQKNSYNSVFVLDNSKFFK